MESKDISPKLTRWADRLKGLRVSPLTRDYPEPPPGSANRILESVESLVAPEQTRSALTTLSSSGSPFELLLTAYIALISRLTGDEDIAIGTNAESDASPLILRIATSPDESFTQLAFKARQAMVECTADSQPIDDIRAFLKTSLLFHFAAYQTSEPSPYITDDGEATDLRLNVSTTPPGHLELTAYYNQRLFSSARITILLSQLLAFLENASQNPKEAIGRIDLLTPEQRALLPDPTKDLGWSDFRGAIHDIFSSNAARHPERLCVVETRSRITPDRSFTYKHIHEASNILAHHFVHAGIEKGEVVMVYSYRGVDLVVAVMGILKAGATFSVLDPAYPPERQNIYLEVARPRALVIIEKATLEAGELAEPVQTFVTANLDLRTKIPGLALKDGGILVGGKINGRDVLDATQNMRATSPGIVVGPDSTPTLSFTSGSEGRPKGVVGRHFSLAYYFDWMAQKFGLSSEDRFTMLSGIAHDPIQRDIFTPLFLGARLLVPSKDDIQNEKLAEWMRAHEATVTHLTPAMGQILVGGASAQFEKLHHAFFVGDTLIKRDCRALQNLAPNVNIVNMYGTTETQRAVSYYEIPSFTIRQDTLTGLKDVIPAGQGMHNVQLLVVNRFDRSKLCAVGEVGEIYVRAGGLAEGYLGTPELTEQKFVKNWFTNPSKWIAEDEARVAAAGREEPWRAHYLGPRDRLYRSGDLGRYTPTGDVECSGRADDQVKIRGFRIELGEIDTHLSQHPLVRENVTLVRRDKFEEQILVSYIVPEERPWQAYVRRNNIQLEGDHADQSLGTCFRRYQALRHNVREYLRTKLPAYAVPSLVVPMPSLPLNPSGKIDKPKLPFPDTAAMAAVRRHPSSVSTTLTETEHSLAHIWAKIVPSVVPNALSRDDSFFDLGGNSMSAQQLPFHVRRTWRGVDLSIGRIYANPTLKGLAVLIERASQEDSFDVGSVTASAMNGTHDDSDSAYSREAEELESKLPTSFHSAGPFDRSTTPSVFLTGATGFLGAYILRDLLRRSDPEVKVVALVRAKSADAAMGRIRATCRAYGVWSDHWQGRLRALSGDLGSAKFGLSDDDWTSLANTIDVVIHNGAQVHWINPYTALKPSNVMGTIDALRLCASGKAKKFTFVSSTSVLDTDHYVYESEKIIAAGGDGISEADDLSGSRTGLGTGYGQSKWVAEYLVRAAGHGGLRGMIVRPGYVLGDSTSGVTNTDDFLIRMVKGCIQLSSRPNINNTINMVPVDHVAQVVVACAFHPTSPLTVAHVTGHPRLRFNQFLGALETYGYQVPISDYVPWTGALENYVGSSRSDRDGQLALMPLFTFVANDLPLNTRAAELDDTNARAALTADAPWSGEDVSAGTGVVESTIGLYLAYLVELGFLPPPTTGSKTLPQVHVSEEQKAALTSVGGRGALT